MRQTPRHTAAAKKKTRPKKVRKPGEDDIALVAHDFVERFEAGLKAGSALDARERMPLQLPQRRIPLLQARTPSAPYKT